MPYTVITDSAANLNSEQIKVFGVKIISLSYNVNGEEFLSYIPGQETDYKAFYNMLRNKENVKTSLVSYERVETAFTEEFEKGNDILYISFSSALSGSFLVAKNCAEDLAEKYPDRKVVVIDSLCASAGQGLLVKYAVDKMNEGFSLEETAKWLEDNKLNLVHLFTVDDLFFLKRGGRLSGTVAVVGTILNIKPLLHVSDEGKLVSYGKARGRRSSINELVDRMGELGTNLNEQDVFISHGDCIEDAEYMAEQIKEKYAVKSITINYIDQVIGSHSGPGTLALFFMGSKR